MTVEIREAAARPDPERRFRLTRAVGRDGIDLDVPVDFAAGQPVTVRLRLPGSERRLELAATVGGDLDGAPRELLFGNLAADARDALVAYVEERLGLT
jgi:hypothetical protein